MPLRNRDPRSKEELLDRMMSFDFDGDIRHLGSEPARITRLSPNRIALTFPASDRTYELSVHIPRTEVAGESRSFAQDGPEEPFPTVEAEATLKERERETRKPRQRQATPPAH